MQGRRRGTSRGGGPDCMLLGAVREVRGVGKRRLALLFGVGLLVAAVAARLNNAWVAPVLAGYDAFGHFTYIWFVAETGRVPLPTHGWSFFHPPLYYAFMAGLWNALADLDPYVRLRIGRLVVAALGCLPAVIAWQVVRRRHPGDRWPRLVAALATLLVPVQLYSAGFLGNEGLHAVFGNLSLLALLAVLARPSLARALALGLCLGLAMLSKFSAIVTVLACLATIVLRSCFLGRDFSKMVRVLVATTAAIVVICGPWYLRSIQAYGTPFQLSRPTFMVSYVEGNQPQAARGWADYLTFDPVIFRRPAWPRGSSPLTETAPYGLERSMRESVWTGLYANAWFDGFGGWVLPSVVESESARRAGQALLVLGLVPTGLMGLGLCSALLGLRRRGWDDAVVAFALVLLAMLALFVYGTHQAPIAAAVKATYFTPISVVFAFWLVEGLILVQRRWPPLFRPVVAVCAATGLLSLVVFWQGFVFDSNLIRRSLPTLYDAETLQTGVVQYAGGRRARAREMFERATESDYHLALENLGFLAADEGRPLEALRLLRRAAHVQREQPGAGPFRHDEFVRLTSAEIEHSMAVILYGMGRRAKAIQRWYRALARDPGHAEALWCLALARLEDDLAGAGDDDGARRHAFDLAARALASVRALDPGLEEGWTMGATVEAAAGDCQAARRILDEKRDLPWWTQRKYPVETGTGAGFSASIGRRRLITPVLAELDPSRALAACEIKTD